MERLQPPERRAGRARRPRARRALARVRSGLYRPLAGDDDRVRYWIRHVRLGVLLTEVAAWTVVGYALVTPTAGHLHPVLFAAAGIAIVSVPLVLLLPLAEMMRDSRGPLLFYGWTVGTAVLVAVGARFDGGSSSPLFCLLFLTLGFMAVAYPPYGVVAMGAFMSAAYLLLAVLPAPSVYGFFLLAVMAAFTMLCAMSSANQWEAYDRSVLLLRTHELLAATDPLTGALNRRAFLDRLDAAIDTGGDDGTAVVCLVDLDGFKSVNDRDGHAAGDAVLRAVTVALGAAVRETDSIARLGGDEFAVLATVGDPADAEVLADRIRTGVAGVGARAGVTASVGVTAVRPGDDEHEVLLRADAAMYRAKAAGGDRVAAAVAE
ncbi:GGDEF domain-containing protein [Blastococcus sp. SYSU D00820]